MPRLTRALPAAASAAIALTALAGAPPASAAVTESHYQANLEINCGGVCSRKFPQLPANQALQIDHVSCDIITDGVMSFLRVTLLPTSLNFTYPLPTVWQRKFFNDNVYTVSADVNIRVPNGRQVQIDLVAGGAPRGVCAITGTRLTNS